MIDKVQKYMEKYRMLPTDAHVVLGVSGGADSVCLLYILTKLRERFDFELKEVHVNHLIRPEAEADAAYVKTLCEKWNVPFVLIEADVEQIAKKDHLSCEEAGRMVRYQAFNEAFDGDEGGCNCVAVAHNRDDRAETLLFHLFRGTGLDGMGSIRPVRENADGSRIVRPLLDCSRAEIEEFLRTEQIAWCTDRTNYEDIYTRNRIRNRILPYAEEQICSGAKEHLAQEAALLERTAAFVDRQTDASLQRCARIQKECGQCIFSLEDFWEEDSFLQEHMIRSVMKLLGKKKDMTSAHIREVKKLFREDCSSGRLVRLPVCGITVHRQFGEVIFTKTEAADERGEVQQIQVEEGVFEVPGLGQISVRILKRPPESPENTGFWENIPENKYTKWFDYDKIIEPVVFRTRQTGDYLTINNKLEKKSLKRYLIEEKIPAFERDRLMLLADGSHILWVPGHRISAAYKVTAQTNLILEVTIRERQQYTNSGGERNG